jgi:hypothetical protein
MTHFSIDFSVCFPSRPGGIQALLSRHRHTVFFRGRDFVARTLAAVAMTLLILCGGSLPVQAAEPLTAGLAFSGGAGQVVLDDGLSLADRSFTVEAWVWLDELAGDQTVLGHFRNDDNPLHLVVRDGRVHLGFWADDLTGNTVAPAQQWVHVAFTYDATTRTQ